MRFTRNVFIFSVLFIGAIALSVYFMGTNNHKTQTTNIKHLTVQEVKNAIDTKKDIILIDVRRPEEYQAGHLKNSILLTLDTIGAKAAEVIPDKNKAYFVYCRTGHRSAQAVIQLEQMGYTNLNDMTGGITEWSSMGFPVEK